MIFSRKNKTTKTSKPTKKTPLQQARLNNLISGGLPPFTTLFSAINKYVISDISTFDESLQEYQINEYEPQT